MVEKQNDSKSLNLPRQKYVIRLSLNSKISNSFLLFFSLSLGLQSHTMIKGLIAYYQKIMNTSIFLSMKKRKLINNENWNYHSCSAKSMTIGLLILEYLYNKYFSQTSLNPLAQIENWREGVLHSPDHNSIIFLVC